MKILIIDDEQGIRDILTDILNDEGHKVLSAADGAEGLDMLKTNEVELVLLDVWMPNLGGLETLEVIRRDYPNVTVVMMSGHAMFDQAVTATKLGAHDFLEKPLALKKVLDMVNSVAQTRAKSAANPKSAEYRDPMLGDSPSMSNIRATIDKTAKSDARILILGENGSGKELIAREIHEKSLRADKPFIGVNCAAIPDNLIESELFGHVKGAFTGASADRDGKFRLADGGTIFLDEVADMSLPAQAKVLRVLQEMTLTPIGSSENIKINVRVIAATNKDIKSEIASGNFREDLYYRLNVVQINVPSLRERCEDIPTLIRYFTGKLTETTPIVGKEFTPDAMQCMQSYRWPGNIRQLRNIVERLMILSPCDMITIDDVRSNLDEESKVPTKIESSDYMSKYDDKSLNTAKDEFERELIEKRLIENEFNLAKAAKALGVFPSNMYAKISKLGIDLDKLRASVKAD